MEDGLRKYRLEEERKELGNEIAGISEHISSMQRILDYKKLFLQNFDDLFEPREIKVKTFWSKKFCFYVNPENKVVAAGYDIITGPHSSDRDYVSLIKGQDALWEFIRDNFYPFVYKIEEVLSQISLEDAKRLVDLMKLKYDTETKELSEVRENHIRNAHMFGREERYTMGTYSFYQRMAIDVDIEGKISRVEVYDRDDKNKDAPIIISTSLDNKGAWKLIKENILNYMDFYQDFLNLLCFEEASKFIETIEDAREERKPKALLLEI